MTEEFNLSEKIKINMLYKGDSQDIIYKSDVKEFIKRLKEELIQENVWDEEHMGIIEKKIDKLAGKSLI